MKKLGTVLIVISLAMIFADVVIAAELKDVLSERYAEQKDICPPVKSTIREGIDTRDVVRVALLMGHSACYVIKCSIEAKGELEKIIFGAIEGGATADVISRCAVEAGAIPDEIARILERADLPGLGYTPPPGAPSPVIGGFPGGPRGGGLIISPSRL
ncbi:MAG: hypothetical protein HZA17_06240 [Nitrospirae bacterium]|nr:hypothetical protein [Nitrospirota bacterium]